MSRTRPRINVRFDDEPADDSAYEADATEYADIAPGNDDEDAVGGDADSQAAYYDESEDYDETPTGAAGLFGTPARAIMLVASVLLLLLVTAMLAWLLGSRAAQKTTAYVGTSSNTGISGLQTAVRVGALAPDFALNDIYTGKLVSLTSLRGKPVWVNFWASWCGPCKAEMPEMKQLYAKYKDKGLVILGVDDREDNSTVTQFIQSNSYNWTFVIDGDGSILEKYVVSGIPTHLFLDKDGVIRYMVVGGISGDMMDDGLAKIMKQ